MWVVDAYPLEICWVGEGKDELKFQCEAGG